MSENESHNNEHRQPVSGMAPVHRQEQARIRRVISGGQTGADRAGLDAAIRAGVSVGGYCPSGRKSEDGVIPDRYPLEEIRGGYRQRTRMNVEAADGMTTCLTVCGRCWQAKRQSRGRCINSLLL